MKLTPSRPSSFNDMVHHHGTWCRSTLWCCSPFARWLQQSEHHRFPRGSWGRRWHTELTRTRSWCWKDRTFPKPCIYERPDNSTNGERQFSPEDIWPFSKSSFKTDHNSREKAKERCNSDGHPRSSKEGKKGTKGKSATKKRKSPQTQKKINVDSSEDDDTFCIVCCEPYLNSRPNENWVQCVICMQ